jgi:hypothetical protein
MLGRRARANPFASPDKAISVRVASVRSSPTVVQSDDEDGGPLFNFNASTAKAETAAQAIEPESPPPSPTPSPSPARRLEHFLDSSPEPEDEPFRQSSPLSPSQALVELEDLPAGDYDPEEDSPRHSSMMSPTQALAELQDLPEGALEDDYQPTPTLKEEAPSQLPDHLRSSSDRRLVEESDNDSDTEEQKPDVSFSPAPTPTPTLLPVDEEAKKEMEEDIEMEDAQPIALPPPVKKVKKRVAFQLSQDSQASSASLSQDVPARTSQSTTDCEASLLLHPSSILCAESPQLTAESAPAPPAPKPSYPLSRHSFTFAQPPPTSAELLASIETYKVTEQGRSRVVYQDPFYSKPADVPHKDREYGGRRFKIKGSTLEFRPHFLHFGKEREVFSNKGRRPLPMRTGKVTAWEYAPGPPTLAQANEWLQENGSFSVFPSHNSGLNCTLVAGLAQTSKKPRFDPTKSQVRLFPRHLQPHR